MTASRVFGFNVAYYVKSGAAEPLALQKMAAAFERAAVEFGKFGEYAFPKLIPILEREVRGQFKAEGHGPNRGKWAPLTPAYAKTKKGGSILRRSGALFDALTKSRSPLAQRAYTASQLSYGTVGLTYASFHQTGTQKKDGAQRMVDRPPFDFTTEFEQGLKAAASSGARELVKKSGIDAFADTNSWRETTRELSRGLDRALENDG